MNTKYMVFVFGSNMSGIHGAGAAAYAHKKLGAPWGKGEGCYSGNDVPRFTYALPTKGYRIEPLQIQDIRAAVDRFIAFAMAEPNMKFQVTQVGCGLGGFTKEQIAPLFFDAPLNCFFDEAWENILGDDFEYWGTFP